MSDESQRTILLVEDEDIVIVNEKRNLEKSGILEMIISELVENGLRFSDTQSSVSLPFRATVCRELVIYYLCLP